MEAEEQPAPNSLPISQSSSADLFPSSPGFTEALASLPLVHPSPPRKPTSSHPYADALDLSSPMTNLQPTFPATWAEGKNVFAAANRKRKRSASPDEKTKFRLRNVVPMTNGMASVSTVGSQWRNERKATVDDITVTSSRAPSSPTRETKPFLLDDEDDEIFPITAEEESADATHFHIQGRGNIGEDGTSAYIDSEAYDGSKFGGIGEYLRHRRMKLQIQNKAIAIARGGQKPQIFEGLYLYINGYVKPSLETCREMIMAHGGTYIPYLDRKSMITHIIATTLTPSKHLEFAKYKVATPQWLVDSAACGKLLDWRDFKLVAGGGVEEGMRGGLGGWMKGTQSGGMGMGKGKGKEKKVEMEDMEGTLSESGPSMRPDGPPEKAEMAVEQLDDDGSYHDDADMDFNLDEGPISHVPVDIDNGPDPSIQPLPPIAGPSTPSKSVAPIFAGLSPSTIKSIVAPSKGQAPPTTTDPMTFEMTVASGYAKYQENQDAKRLMQDKEWRGMHTAVNEGFLEGYYQNSRLHHLSAWKAELKVLVAQAQKEAESSDVIQKLAPHASQEDKSLSLATSVLPRASPRKGGALDTPSSGTKVIFHVDFDAFFVNCGLATRPELKGKPVVVCHSQGGDGSKPTGETGSRVVSDRGQSSTSEIASCSYEARASGVKNGMSLGQARKLCPDVQTIPYEFETYKKFSLSFYTILMAYADELQAVSVDEALIDVSTRVTALAQAPPAFVDPASTMQPDSSVPEGTLVATNVEAAPLLAKDWAKELAEMIRSDVRAATGCEVSIGIANNIMLARLATRHAKPAGSFHMTSDLVADFLKDLDIGELPGFAYSAKKRMESTFGDSTCGALLAKSKGSLQACLGPKSGETLFNFIRGVDDRKLEPHKERKSVSAEVNLITAIQYGIRFVSTEEAEKFLCDLSEEVGRRLKGVSRKGRMLTLKVMVRHPDAPLEAPKFMGHGVCNVFNKSMPVSDGRNGATDDGLQIGKAILLLYRSQDFDATELRGIGIQMQKLEGGSEEHAREAGQRLLQFGKFSDVDKSHGILGKELSPPPDVREEDSDIELVHNDVPAFRSKTRRNPKSLTRLAKAAAPTAIAAPDPPMTSRSKFGYKPRVKALKVPRPEDIDLDIWTFMEAAEKRDFRTAWKQQGLSVPAALRADTKGDTVPTEKHTIFGKRQTKAERTSVPPADRLQQRNLDAKVIVTRARSKTPQIAMSSESEVEARPSKTLAAHATSDIEQLGINVDFFRNLPDDLAAEVWAEEVKRKANAKRLLRKGKPVKLDAMRKIDRSPQASRVVKTIAAPGMIRPKVNKTSDVEQILQMITDWMDTKGDQEPMEGEIKVFRKYLLRCADPSTGGLGGIQDASRVLAWWRKICSDRFAGDRTSSLSVAWRTAFHRVQADVNDIAVQRFGVSIAI